MEHTASIGFGRGAEVLGIAVEKHKNSNIPNGVFMLFDTYRFSIVLRSLFLKSLLLFSTIYFVQIQHDPGDCYNIGNFRRF